MLSPVKICSNRGHQLQPRVIMRTMAYLKSRETQKLLVFAKGPIPWFCVITLQRSARVHCTIGEIGFRSSPNPEAMALRARRVFGVGVDLVHIPRVAKTFRRFGQRFLLRAFHPDEIAIVNGLSGDQRDQFLASRCVPRAALQGGAHV